MAKKRGRRTKSISGFRKPSYKREKLRLHPTDGEFKKITLSEIEDSTQKYTAEKMMQEYPEGILGDHAGEIVWLTYIDGALFRLVIGTDGLIEPQAVVGIKDL